MKYFSVLWPYFSLALICCLFSNPQFSPPRDDSEEIFRPENTGIHELAEAQDALWGFRESGFLPTQRHHPSLACRRPSNHCVSFPGHSENSGASSRTAQQPRPEEPTLDAWSGGGGGEPVAMAEPAASRWSPQPTPEDPSTRAPRFPVLTWGAAPMVPSAPAQGSPTPCLSLQ